MYQYSLRALFLAVTVAAIAAWQINPFHWPWGFLVVVLVGWGLAALAWFVTASDPAGLKERPAERWPRRILGWIVGGVAGGLVGCAVGLVLWLSTGGHRIMDIGLALRLGGFLGITIGLFFPRWAAEVMFFLLDLFMSG